MLNTMAYDFPKVDVDLPPPNSVGENFSLRASSIGPIRVLTLGIVLCRYCHVSCNGITKPE